MSSRATRGQEAEVSQHAKLDKDAARTFLANRDAALAENELRRQRRESCLRDSAMTGAFAGTVGATLAYYIVTRPAGADGKGAALGKKLRPWELLGINVSGKAMGGAMQSFVVWMGFFMPFMFVSNYTRWRCQKQGLQPYKPPVLTAAVEDA